MYTELQLSPELPELHVFFFFFNLRGNEVQVNVNMWLNMYKPEHWQSF